MTTNTEITLYHAKYDSVTRTDRFEPSCFAASWHSENKIVITDGGVQSADIVKIRIPTTKPIEIKKGDRIVMGKCNAATPPKDAYKVLSFSDNRRGSPNTQHWRVECE